MLRYDTCGMRLRAGRHLDLSAHGQRQERGRVRKGAHLRANGAHIANMCMRMEMYIMFMCMYVHRHVHMYDGWPSGPPLLRELREVGYA